MSDNSILDQAIEWAESDDLIRAVILVGSHAERRPTDELSDYDLSIFCTDTAPFVNNCGWLEDIAPVWVSIPEQFTFLETIIPTRLAIFEHGYKVDFAFYPMKILDMLASIQLPDEFNMGYKVLIDKDQLTNRIPQPTYEGFNENKPNEQDFHNLVNEFWFEVYHVAKYLRREDLWSVQFRLSSIHHHILLKMICWNEAAKHDFHYSTHPIGKRLHDWISEDTWKALHQVFPHFDVNDGWDALNNTITLFKKLSQETAGILGYSDLTNFDLAGYLQKMIDHGSTP
jgi:aminoglycoside 6-adenylyltransferase